MSVGNCRGECTVGDDQTLTLTVCCGSACGVLCADVWTHALLRTLHLPAHLDRPVRPKGRTELVGRAASFARQVIKMGLRHERTPHEHMSTLRVKRVVSQSGCLPPCIRLLWIHGRTASAQITPTSRRDIITRRTQLRIACTIHPSRQRPQWLLAEVESETHRAVRDGRGREVG